MVGVPVVVAPEEEEEAQQVDVGLEVSNGF